MGSLMPISSLGTLSAPAAASPTPTRGEFGMLLSEVGLVLSASGWCS